MKTIANIIIINRSKCQIRTSVSSHHNISFQRTKLCLRLDEFHRSRQQSQHWTAKSATGEPEIPQKLAS